VTDQLAVHQTDIAFKGSAYPNDAHPSQMMVNPSGPTPGPILANGVDQPDHGEPKQGNEIKGGHVGRHGGVLV